MTKVKDYIASVSLFVLHGLVFPTSSLTQSGPAPPIVIGVTINESEQPILYNGWPLLANVMIVNASASEEHVPVHLSLGWKNSIHIIVQDTSGTTHSWPFHVVNATDEDIILDSLTFAEVGYWLDSAEVQLIPPGEYTLVAILDSSAYTSWGSDSTIVTSVSHKLTVSGAPDSGGVQQKTEKDLLNANLYILKGDHIKALEYLNGILSYNPTNLSTLSLIGKLLEEAGDAGGALQAYASGLKAFYEENTSPAEPPIELMRAENALIYKLAHADSFVVTLAAKDSANPLFAYGSTSCYEIDKLPFRELQLMRGKSYTFVMKDIPSSDPFYFSSNVRGAGLEPFTDGVIGTPADGNSTVTFSVANNAPDDLYYQSTSHDYVGWRINVIDSADLVSATDDNPGNPKEYSLSAAYPNPFNPSTTITYSLPKESFVTFKVYDLLGQEVAILMEGVEQAGYRQVEFNANKLSSGVYFYRLEAISIGEIIQSFSQTKKILLIK